MARPQKRTQGRAAMTPAFRWWPTFVVLLTDYLKVVGLGQKPQQQSVRGKIFAHTQAWGRLFRGDRLQQQAIKIMVTHAKICMTMIDSVGTDQREDLAWSEDAIRTNVDKQIEVLNLARGHFPRKTYRELVELQTRALARLILALLDDNTKAFDKEQKLRTQYGASLGAVCAEWL